MKFTLLPFLFIIMFLNGCVTHYGPAILGSHATPLVSAPAKDRTKYTMTSLDFTDGLTYEPHENNSIFRFRNVWVSSIDKADMNIGYQLFGGNYTVSKLKEFKGDYSFYGGGVDASVCGYWKLSSLDMGIGFRFQYTIELGDYYRFRKASNKPNYAENTTSRFQPMFSILPLLRYNINETSNIGLQTVIGFPPGADILQFITPVVSYQNSTFISWVSWLPSQYPSDESHPSFSVGIGIWR